MKILLTVCFYSMLLMTGSLYAKQAQLLSFNYAIPFDRQIQFEFFLSQPVHYKYFMLSQPDRLVVDFKNTVKASVAQLRVVNHPSIKSLRTAPRNETDYRVVFDFKAGVKPIKFRLVRDTHDAKHLRLNIYVDHKIEVVKPVIKDKQLEKNQTVNQPLLDQQAHVNNSQFGHNSEERESELFSEWEISGKVTIEDLGFFNNKLDSRQHNNYISGSLEPEIYREWDNGKQSFTFVPFYRYSQYDNRRTHFDIRELTWMLAEEQWELRVGFRKVFWGVVEGLHLVDIINQTDVVENTDTEDKLGQPMINLALIRDWGTIDLFVMPGFRERTFPGPEGRLRSVPEVAVSDALYEKHGFEKHMAYAIRWSHAIGDWDIGLSHFYGTSREPRFVSKISANTGELQLIPYYELINQTGLDVQLTHEDWILKHEAILRSGQGKTFYASSTGVEYTLFDLFETGLDLGFLVEYMYDTRGESNILAPFQDDILTGMRFAFNDVQSTEILAGIIFDRTNNAKFYNIEASRRLGDSFTIDLELRLYSGAPIKDPTYMFRDDDHLRVEFAYHF